LPEGDVDSVASQKLIDLITEQGALLRGCIHLRAG
jgi:hypothetical protein